MTQPIRTKFHKIRTLFESGEVYVSAAKGEKANHWNELKPNKKIFNALLQDVEALPKFVIEDELLDLATGEKFHQSLLDMKKAGVLRLPFPAMTVEFNTKNGVRVIVMLRDNNFNEKLAWEPDNYTHSDNKIRNSAFYGIIYVLEEDSDGPYLVINAGMIGIDILDQNDVATLGVAAESSNMFENAELQSKLVGRTFEKNVGYLWKGLCASMLLMHTDGVTKEVIECDKINRKRKQDGKPTIPKHTYLRIGKVYKSSSSDDSSEYIPRRSPRPHWRRGHLRWYWHGKNKTSKMQKYINPKIVALKEEIEDEPSMKKTYQVRK